MFQTAWILCRKDLLIFFRDRTAVLLTLALPILLATIFGSAMQGMMGGGSGGGTPKIALLVEDLDGSPESRLLVELLDGVDGIRVTATSGARRQVAGGKYPAAIVIPAGYGAALGRGDMPELRLLRDPSRQIAQQVIAGNLLVVLVQANLPHVGAGLMGRFLEDIDFPLVGREQAESILRRSWESMDEVVTRLEQEGAFDDEPQPGVGEAGGEEVGEGTGFNFLEDVPALLGLVTEDVVGVRDHDAPPKSAGGSHAVASMAVMMLMFSLVAAGGTLLEEHEGGTLQRLQLSPGAGPSILLGKLLSLGVMGLLQLVVLFAYGALVFDVPVLANPLALALTSLALVLAAAGLGLTFAVACRSRKQLEGLSTLVILVMSAVGGAWFPREVTPDWFQTVGLFTITAYAMDAFHGILWYGKGILPADGLDGIWPQLVALYAIGGVLLLLSFRLFHRRFVLGA